MTVNIALFDDLDAVAQDAAGALDRPRHDLFGRLEWFRLLHAHCPLPGRLIVARASDETGRAWLFLACEKGVARSYANYYSLRAGPAREPPDGPRLPEQVEAMARSLAKAGIWKIDVGPDDAKVAALTGEGFRRAGWITFPIEDKAVWRVSTVDDDFASYWGKRPAKLRNTFKRKAKAAGLEIEICRAFDARAWADYEAVYRASWKPEEGSFAFLRALAGQEGAAGSLRLGIARKEGRAVAVQLWLVEKGSATIHKLAYAEDVKGLSPGTILGEAMFREAIDRDRVETIDYGVGDEPYKADWMEIRDVRQRIVAFNPKSLRGLAGAARAALSALVARVRSG